ncbi:DUF3349 domain-containing protein [Pelagibius sp.]|uniref:DUF3349 domain-containing protein n=1 Tax=Pelagibius sp. TaxID=1931238 RepID=UPI003BAEFB61
MKDLSDVPNHLQSTYKMLLKAFPEGPSQDDYLALVAILAAEMSQRTVAGVVEDLGYCRQNAGYNDVLTALSKNHQPDRASVEKVRRHLDPHGYKAWLAECMD